MKGRAVICEIVTFDIVGKDRAEVQALYEATLGRWRDWPGLIRKTYLYDAAGGRGGGVYLWRDANAAAGAHDAAWCAKAEALYGAAPKFDIYEVPLVLENGG